MPALFVFLLKVNIALIVFCLGYYFVLRRLTFYTLNRVYLGIAIIFSSIYPFINLDDFLLRHQEIAVPVQQVVIDWKVPAERFIEQPGYWFWATVIFWIGVVVFAGKLGIQLISLYKLYKKSEPAQIEQYDVRVVKANISPFSFWQSIYINPDNLNPGDLKGILQHEQIHVSEWHTMDILLAEISVVFYWFNPGVWLMKRAVRENIEFITDRKVLQKGMDSKTYQYSLLNVSFNATTSTSIINHFNFSTLKKRITMMNAKQSSNVNLTRYAFLIPVVLVCLLTISLSKAEIVKNTKVVYKNIAASVSNMITIAPVKADTVPVKKKVTDTSKKMNTLTVTTFANQSITIDTPKKLTLSLTSNSSDSVVYYINDVKVSKNEMNDLSPNDIKTISVTKDAKINKVGGTIHIYTKDSPDVAGVTKITLTDFTPDHGSVPKDTSGTNYKGMPSAITVTGRSRYSSLIMQGHDIKATNEKNVSAYSSDGGVGNNHIIINGVTVRDQSRWAYVVGSSTVDYQNFHKRLIIIDGKEAADQEMHDLNPDDIESVDVLNGKTATEIYGDKAKFGVIKIILKKKKQ